MENLFNKLKFREFDPHVFQIEMHEVASEAVTSPHSTGVMSLACLVCHSTESPSQSFRSSSVSSSDGDGRCAAMVGCLVQRVSVAAGTCSNAATSKVAPFPGMGSSQGLAGAPRLQRSRAVSRDRVRDWNFDEFLVVEV